MALVVKAAPRGAGPAETRTVSFPHPRASTNIPETQVGCMVDTSRLRLRNAGCRKVRTPVKIRIRTSVGSATEVVRLHGVPQKWLASRQRAGRRDSIPTLRPDDQ